MERDDAGQIEVGERVSADDQEGVVQQVLGQTDRTGGAGRCLFHRVVDMHAQLAAVTEMVADEARQEGQGDHDLIDPMSLHQFQDVLDGGFVDHGDHRLGLVGGQRPQPGALTACHDDCLHLGLLPMHGMRSTSRRSRPCRTHSVRHENKEKSGRPDLNRRPSGPQPDALPNYATSRRVPEYSAPPGDGLHQNEPVRVPLLPPDREIPWPVGSRGRSREAPVVSKVGGSCLDGPKARRRT